VTIDRPPALERTEKREDTSPPDMDVLASTVNILVDVVTLEVNITTRSTSTNSEFIEDDYDFQIKL
jgi:hypothetical protein